MPIYEFNCKSCGKQFEELVRTMGDNDSVQCPHCGSHDVEQLISCFSFTSDSGARPASPAGKSCGPCTKTSCSSCG